jgi:hypothetical protein
MIGRFKLGLIAAFAIVSLPASAQPQSSDQRPPPDPNERICQDIPELGSRLAKKRICATRQEWEDKKRQDREATEKAQTQLCVNNPATGKC